MQRLDGMQRLGGSRPGAAARPLNGTDAAETARAASRPRREAVDMATMIHAGGKRKTPFRRGGGGGADRPRRGASYLIGVAARGRGGRTDRSRLTVPV
ncbi:hypothetical protein [Streptomyces sp. NPDC047706]|uniref:hypothetical protein n=1 Tax=Streptomyces sp. NPDC047706 TaxID=3365486 RepID=UPI00371B3CD1